MSAMKTKAMSNCGFVDQFSLTAMVHKQTFGVGLEKEEGGGVGGSSYVVVWQEGQQHKKTIKR